jgi:hypothetical protein
MHKEKGMLKLRNAHSRGCNAPGAAYIKKTEIRGRTAPKRLLAPSLLGGKEVCVVSLDILET